MKSTSFVSDLLSNVGEYNLVNENVTLTPNNKYIIDTAGKDLTITLPSTANAYSEIVIFDKNSAFEDFPFTLTSAGKINGQDADIVVNLKGIRLQLVYVNATIGWKISEFDTKFLKSFEIDPSDKSDEYILQYNETTGKIEFVKFEEQTPTPTLSGPSTGSESADVVVTITNYIATYTYNISVTGGSYSRTDDDITWTLPDIDDDEEHTMTVTAKGPVYSVSYPDTHTLTVENLPLTGDTALVIEGSSFDTWVEDGSGYTYGSVKATADAGWFMSIPEYQGVGEKDWGSIQPVIRVKTDKWTLAGGKTVTPYNTLTKTGEKVFGTASGYFNGSASYLSIPNTPSDNVTDDMNGVTLFQNIATQGSRRFEFFTIGTDFYITVSNLYDGTTYSLNSKIYKWNGTNFSFFQNIATQGGTHLKPFTIGSDTYIGVCNTYNGSTYDINSNIYKWNGTSFASIQSIATHGAFYCESFVIGADNYITIANNTGSESNIYKWNGTTFSSFQTISHSARCAKFFTIGTDHYLSYTNYYGNNVIIYKWNGTNFSSFQTMASNNGAWSCDFFTIGTDHYLAVANYSSDSYIYKWNGTNFSSFQTISGASKGGCEFFTISGRYYLTFSTTATNNPSTLYKWNGTNFGANLSILTCYTVGMSHFAIGAVNYIAVTMEYPYNQDSKIYKFTNSDFGFGDNNFTIDCRVRHTSFNSTEGYFTRIASNQTDTVQDSWEIYAIQGGGNNYYAFKWQTIGEVFGYATFNFTASLDTWYHIAVVRNGSNIKMYINGTAITLTGGADIGSVALKTVNNPLLIGARSGEGSREMSGYIDEFRVSKGIARWTTNFTPPTAAYSTDSYTKLLLHMDGSDNGTTFTDSSVESTTSTLLLSGPRTISTSETLLLVNNDNSLDVMSSNISSVTGSNPYTVNLTAPLSEVPAKVFGYIPDFHFKYGTSTETIPASAFGPSTKLTPTLSYASASDSIEMQYPLIDFETVPNIRQLKFYMDFNKTNDELIYVYADLYKKP